MGSFRKSHRWAYAESVLLCAAIDAENILLYNNNKTTETCASTFVHSTPKAGNYNLPKFTTKLHNYSLNVCIHHKRATVMRFQSPAALDANRLSHKPPRCRQSLPMTYRPWKRHSQCVADVSGLIRFCAQRERHIRSPFSACDRWLSLA